jgi:hypothetical protein
VGAVAVSESVNGAVRLLFLDNKVLSSVMYEASMVCIHRKDSHGADGNPTVLSLTVGSDTKSYLRLSHRTLRNPRLGDGRSDINFLSLGLCSLLLQTLIHCMYV